MEKSPRELIPDYVNRPAMAENQEGLAKPDDFAEIAQSMDGLKHRQKRLFWLANRS
jgi:hypothetical protein